VREDALDSIARKRANAEGAALFWIVPRQRNTTLLELLVAYQTMWDYLDSASERGASEGEANTHQLHLALAAALDPEMPITDYYRLHPWRDDGGYLDTLVDACRERCPALPSFKSVSTLVCEAARRCTVQALNHNPNPIDRERALRAWAVRECPNSDAPWFESTAAASASVAPHALLALAAESTCEEHEIARTHAAYQSVSPAIAMLDSYADQADDAATDAHSYIAHYADPDTAVERLADIVERAMRATRSLTRGHRHAVISACMVAMYLSKNDDTNRTPAAGRLARAGGSLTTLLLPVLRLWRAVYSLHSV
jgi:tetraprenyl-beta-curcumene synthase